MTLAAIDRRAVDALSDTVVDAHFKGVPPGDAPFALRGIRERGWRLGGNGLLLPLLVARESALAHNIGVMAAFCKERGIELVPHGKTSMSPQLFLRQIEAGAWGITAATAEQLAVYRRYGVRRIVLANELAGEANVRYVIGELAKDPEFQLYTFVDSPAGVKALEAAARGVGLQRPIDVLLEIGYPNGRTGVRTEAEAFAVADAARSSGQAVRLCGIAGFEGLLSNVPSRRLQAAAFLREMERLASILRARGDLPAEYIVSAGGSSAFDLVADRFARNGLQSPRVMLRSGCYVVHDHGLYRDAPAAERRFLPALELWSYVQSRPEATLVYLGFGRRDAPSDSGYPVPLYAISANGKRKPVQDHAIEELNDQHARMRVPEDADIAIGDIVVLGISHPCGAFDRWKFIPVADDEDRVIDALLTFF